MVGSVGSKTHVPLRTCVGCRRQRPKAELVRIVRTPDGVRPDPRGVLPGRGAYVCPDEGCITAAARRRARALRHALRGVSEAEAVAALEAVREQLDRSQQRV